ncbi:hypothetical protein TSAR_013396 [Trichomalopsis sarcophagae]|uniref:Uncharacterized protein n=1 Tax=Trichomalopsis sarcophagae TaxID=543379 RepID=A0A232ED70_9HYME|nr:hypothetical protein TSAR_013396 [Trichomalopsis sarcophagae]
MWCEWKPRYSGISKRIILFSDMTVHVSCSILNMIAIGLRIYIEESLVHLDYRETIQSPNDIINQKTMRLKKRSKIHLGKVKKFNEKVKRLKKKIVLLKQRVKKSRLNVQKLIPKLLKM